jgi:hypothetical protein
MTEKCKFEVDVTYNSDFFAEGEIRETIKKAIRDLNDIKEQKFGKRVMCDPGKTNKGISCNVTQQVVCHDNNESLDIVETLVSLSSCMDDDQPNIVLPEPKIEELMSEVRRTFSK